MYIYIYIYIYIPTLIHPREHACAYIYRFLHTDICTCTPTQILICIGTHAIYANIVNICLGLVPALSYIHTHAFRTVTQPSSYTSACVYRLLTLHIHMHIHIHIHIHIHMNMHMIRFHIQIHIPIRIDIRIHIHSHIYIHVYTVYKNIHVQIHTSTDIYTKYMRVYIYTHTPIQYMHLLIEITHV